MISVTVITFNEEQNISKALSSIKGIASEIIVVDSGSKDETVKIAKDFGAKVFYRKFDNFANQKNWALSKAKNDWIFSIDADEQISEKLAIEIKEAIKSDKYKGFYIPRRNFILGKEIKYSRWSPDKHVWLWNKNFGSWEGEVHEEVKINGEVGSLRNSKIHNSHKTIKEFFHSNNFYSNLLVLKLFKEGQNFSFWKMIWQSLFEFKIRYFYKLGFLDGRRGFILAYLMAIYKLTIWIKLWELKKTK